MKKIIINYRTYFLIVVFILESCSSYSQSKRKLSGSYTNRELSNIELKLHNNKFSLIDNSESKHQPLYKCCDTISFGAWKLDSKNFILLKTPEYLGNFLDIEVNESNEKLNRELKVFRIDNPIEFHYKKFGEKHREISYRIIITTKNDVFEKLFDGNTLEFSTKSNIKEIEVFIDVECDIPLRNSIRNVYTLPYKIQNSYSNVFKINIPKLDYGFLSYKRINGDYIKITKENNLLWDGVLFEKKDNVR